MLSRRNNLLNDRFRSIADALASTRGFELVLAEHDDKSIRPVTLSAVTAAAASAPTTAAQPSDSQSSGRA